MWKSISFHSRIQFYFYSQYPFPFQNTNTIPFHAQIQRIQFHSNHNIHLNSINQNTCPTTITTNDPIWKPPLHCLLKPTKQRITNHPIIVIKAGLGALIYCLWDLGNLGLWGIEIWGFRVGESDCLGIWGFRILRLLVILRIWCLGSTKI